MRVKAIKIGYYGGKLREIGNEFDITDKAHFSKIWMEKVAVRGEPKEEGLIVDGASSKGKKKKRITDGL